jgi:hypothetical protein
MGMQVMVVWVGSKYGWMVAVYTCYAIHYGRERGKSVGTGWLGSMAVDEWMGGMYTQPR